MEPEPCKLSGFVFESFESELELESESESDVPELELEEIGFKGATLLF